MKIITLTNRRGGEKTKVHSEHVDCWEKSGNWTSVLFTSGNELKVLESVEEIESLFNGASDEEPSIDA